LKDWLCEEDVSKELNKIVELKKILRKWNRSKDVKKKVGSSEAGQTINKKKPTDFSDNSKRSGQRKCFICSLSNYTFSNCKYKTYKCKISNEVGHLAKM